VQGLASASEPDTDDDRTTAVIMATRKPTLIQDESVRVRAAPAARDCHCAACPAAPQASEPNDMKRNRG